MADNRNRKRPIKVKFFVEFTPDRSSGKRKQKVHIEYSLVGFILVDELIKAEQA